MMIDGMLADVARKAMERWFTSVILPGLAFAIVLASAHDLSWAHMADFPRLRADASRWLTGQRALAGDAILVIGAVCAGIVAGLVAVGLSFATSAFWLKYTRIGQCIHVIDADVETNYGVSLARAWPRIWLIASDNARLDVQASWDGYSSACLLAAWGVIYALLGLYWPPSIVVGVLLLIISHWSSYRCVLAFAKLTRALADVTINQLAAILGVEIPHGRVTPDVGQEINEILHAAGLPAGGHDLFGNFRSMLKRTDSSTK